MKIVIHGLNSLHSLFQDVPRFSFTTVIHFEVSGDWLYFTVSGWAVGFRGRLSIHNPENAAVEFTLLTDDVLRTLHGGAEDIGSREHGWDIYPAMKYILHTVDGKPHTYNWVSAPKGQFIPTGGVPYPVPWLDVADMSAGDHTELVNYTGGQVYVNNPLSPMSPIYRDNEHIEVENFSTSSALFTLGDHLLVGSEEEAQFLLTPTHAVIRDEGRGLYVFTERYAENPYYTSRALLYGLLLDSQTKGGFTLPEGVTEALGEHLGAGVVRLVTDPASILVCAYADELIYSGPHDTNNVSSLTRVDIDDLYRALILCGPDATLTTSTAEGRTALLVRSATGAALLPTKE